MPLVSYRNSFRTKFVPRPIITSIEVGKSAEIVMWPEVWLLRLREMWGKLHQRALVARGDDSAWLTQFARQLPCGSCREHWNQMLLTNPPRWDDYFRWAWSVHAEVSKKLGKPEFSLAMALARWAPVRKEVGSS